MLISDFNAEESEDTLAYFLHCHIASNIGKDKICFKSLDNPSFNDLIVTNKPGRFQKSTVTCTGISDCYKLVTTVLSIV